MESVGGGAGLFWQAPDPLVVVDPEGRITVANAQAEALFGYGPAELRGQPVEILVPEAHAFAAYLEGAARQAQNGPWPRPPTRQRGMRSSIALRARRKDGSEFPAEVSLSLVRTHRGLRVMAAIRDVRERVRLLEAAREAQSLAERANQAKDIFLSVLSHELRTPLTPILVWAKMLGTRQLDRESITRAAAAIERSARTQLRLVEDLLDMARILAGKFGLTVEPVDLVEVINDAVESVRPAAKEKGIRLHRQLTDLTVRGDPERLQQIVWNLLSNAIKFSAPGTAVHVRLQAVAGSAELTIADHGQGIEPDFLPHIFERFQQQDSSTTRTHGGLGLGLAIVRHLVEAHGGTVQATSPGIGYGATFTVALPRVAAQAPARAVGPAAEPSLVGRRILVVEDEPGTAQALGACLSMVGAEVMLASSVPEALTVVAHRPVDIVLADIDLPGEDGYSLIRRIRRTEDRTGTPPVPALAVTAYARPEDRSQALEAGFHAHLAKPIDPTLLLLEVSKLLAVGPDQPA